MITFRCCHRRQKERTDYAIDLIRHGDPDYERDSLTEKGWREAELLAERIAGIDVRAFYVSPLGRAKDTASLTLKKMNRTAIECEWLREFWVRIQRPDCGQEETIAWDWLPEDWTIVEEYFRRDLWSTTKQMRAGGCPQVHGDRISADQDGKHGSGEGLQGQSETQTKDGVGAEYDWVIRNFDALLAEHGYAREGNVYRVERANPGHAGIFLPFCTGMCALKPSDGRLPDDFMASYVRGSDFCDNGLYGGAQRGNRELSGQQFWRYLASLRGGRGASVRGAILRNL